MNATQAANSQPTAVAQRDPAQAEVRADGRPAVSRASSTPTGSAPTSWKNVPVIVTPGGGSPASTS